MDDFDKYRRRALMWSRLSMVFAFLAIAVALLSIILATMGGD